MITTEGTFYLIKHPDYHSFSIIHIMGDPPAVFPEDFKSLLPGGYRKETQISSEDPYLDYLKADWPEGFEGFEKREIAEIDGVQYRLVRKYLMA